LSGAPSIAITLAFLVQPNIWSVNLFDFHPDTFQYLLLPLAYLALERDQVALFLLSCLCLLTLRESAAIPTVGLGILAVTRPRWRVPGILAIALGASWFGVMNGVI